MQRKALRCIVNPALVMLVIGEFSEIRQIKHPLIIFFHIMIQIKYSLVLLGTDSPNVNARPSLSLYSKHHFK